MMTSNVAQNNILQGGHLAKTHPVLLYNSETNRDRHLEHVLMWSGHYNNFRNQIWYRSNVRFKSHGDQSNVPRARARARMVETYNFWTVWPFETNLGLKVRSHLAIFDYTVKLSEHITWFHILQLLRQMSRVRARARAWTHNFWTVWPKRLNLVSYERSQ